MRNLHAVGSGNNPWQGKQPRENWRRRGSLFETADDMAAEASLDAMDPVDTPGTASRSTAASSRPT